ncbi:hypothetical protein PEC331060_01170 [Pectobacterium carotovorum subsp. carotovorum]|nr:hypothetical protein PEC331060_01170 [Pectobacterium carotovorum subsp. carotovorum]
MFFSLILMSVPCTERTESKATKHLEQRRLMLQW